MLNDISYYPDYPNPPVALWVRMPSKVLAQLVSSEAVQKPCTTCLR